MQSVKAGDTGYPCCHNHEKLVRIGFLERKGDKKIKHLMPTHKGTALVTVMPEQIQSPSMTADWEEKLLLIERGNTKAKRF